MKPLLNMGGVLLSIANMAWVIILAPMAILSAIKDLTDWRAVVFTPVDLWLTRIRELTESVPLLQLVPAGFLSLLYFICLLAAVGVTFRIGVQIEARRQQTLALGIDFGRVEPQPYKGSPVESVVEGGLGALAAGALGLSGPIGWAVALAVMGGMMATRYAVVSGEAADHAARQTAEIEQRRRDYIELQVAHFVRRETLRLGIAAGLATTLVLASLLYQYL